MTEGARVDLPPGHHISLDIADGVLDGAVNVQLEWWEGGSRHTSGLDVAFEMGS